MKVILDTNVFVSGVFFSGPPYRILEAWRDSKIQLVVSQEILDEYRRIGESLAEQFQNVDLEPILELVTMGAEMFSVQNLREPVCKDPDRVHGSPEPCMVQGAFQSDLNDSSIHDNGLAGDVIRISGCKKENDLCHFLWLPYPSKAGGFEDRFYLLLGHFRNHF